MADGTSIHPRVENGRTRFPKSNSCGKPSPARRARVIAAIQKHCDQHPRDAVQARRLAAMSVG